MTEWRAGDTIPADRVNELPIGSAVVIEWLAGKWKGEESDSALVYCGDSLWGDCGDDPEDSRVGPVYTGPDAVYRVLWVPGSGA